MFSNGIKMTKNDEISCCCCFFTRRTVTYYHFLRFFFQKKKKKRSRVDQCICVATCYHCAFRRLLPFFFFFPLIIILLFCNPHSYGRSGGVLFFFLFRFTSSAEILSVRHPARSSSFFFHLLLPSPSPCSSTPYRKHPKTVMHCSFPAHLFLPRFAKEVVAD